MRGWRIRMVSTRGRNFGMTSRMFQARQCRRYKMVTAGCTVDVA